MLDRFTPRISRGEALRVGNVAIVGVLLAAFAVIAALLAFIRYWAFEAVVFDLGYYTNVILHTSRGDFYATSLKPYPFLGDHFAILLVLVAPLFWIAPDPRTLLALLAILLATAVVPAYLILRARHPRLAPLLVLAFVFNPLLHQVASQEFHEISLATPFLGLAIFALHFNRPRLLLVALGLTLLVREDMGVYVAAFGLYLFAARRERRMGLLLMAVGAIWVVTLVKVVIPSIGIGDYWHTDQFAPTINAPAENAAIPERAEGLLRLFAPLAALPLLAAGEQLLWLPGVITLLLSDNPRVYGFLMWHTAPLVPLLWGTIAMLVSRQQPRRAAITVGLLLITNVIGFRLFSPFPGGGEYAGLSYPPDEHTRLGHQILAQIPPDTVIAAQEGLATHLSARPTFYLYPWINPENPPEMILLDTGASSHYPLTWEELLAHVDQWRADPTARIVWEQDGYFLFERVEPEAIPRQGAWEWDEQLRLNSVEVAQTNDQGAYVPSPSGIEADRTSRISLYWEAIGPIPANYSVSIRLLGEDGNIVASQDAWPAQRATATLQPGQMVRDVRYLELPDDVQGEQLSLVVLLYHSDTLLPLGPPEGQVIATLALQ